MAPSAPSVRQLAQMMTHNLIPKIGWQLNMHALAHSSTSMYDYIHLYEINVNVIQIKLFKLQSDCLLCCKTPCSHAPSLLKHKCTGIINKKQRTSPCPSSAQALTVVPSKFNNAVNIDLPPLFCAWKSICLPS